MIHRCIKLLLGLLALKIHARNMKVHYINSYEEIDRIRPTLVLVMAGFKNEHETWCGDTNRALKNIELMKNDPKFLWHKLAVIESSRAVWRSEDDSRLSRKKLSESRLGVTNVPTLLKWKEPEIRLVEADMYLGSNRERSENYGYRHIEYMLMTGHAPSDLSYQPIQMNIDYVFKLADVDRFNPSVVYFKAIYNPGYGKAWDNEVNRYAVRINQMVVDEKFKDHRLVICSIFRNDWYGSDNEYRKGDLGVTLYSASTLMRWNERGYFIYGRELADYRQIETLFDRADYRRPVTQAEITTTLEPPTTTPRPTTKPTTQPTQPATTTTPTLTPSQVTTTSASTTLDYQPNTIINVEAPIDSEDPADAYESEPVVYANDYTFTYDEKYYGDDYMEELDHYIVE